MRRGLLLLALPLALAACGSGAPRATVTADPVSYVRHAALKTADNPSEHQTMNAKIHLEGVDLSMDGSGDYSNTKKDGTFTFSISAAGQSVSMDEVISAKVVYVKSPLFSRRLPGGKTWAKLDVAALGKSMGIDYSALLSRTPAQALQQLEAAGTVTQVGSETIDGVATTHFRVEHLDLAKIPQGAKLEALAHPTYGPIDVWVGNSNGYVYRETLSASYSIKGHSGTATMSTDFSNFGEKVTVHVPPASQTLDVTNRVVKHSATTTVPAP